MGLANKDFYADYWRFMKSHKNITFDENGLSTDEYWQKLNDDARYFAEVLYPTDYAKNLVLDFMKEMERRAKVLEAPYQILKQQERSFEKGSPEWGFFGEFIALSEKYAEPPFLFPDKSNEAEVDDFWQNVHDETKALYTKYGEFAKSTLHDFLQELEKKAEEKSRSGVDGTQLSFDDGYEELGFC